MSDNMEFPRGKHHQADCIVSFFLPILGIIWGLVRLAATNQGDRTTGRSMIIWSVVGMLAWPLIIITIVLSLAFGTMPNTPQPVPTTQTMPQTPR